MRGVLEALAGDLRIHGRLDVREFFIDGSFVPAKKRDRRSAKQNVAKEQRSWPWQTAHGLPVAVCVESARPREVKLAESTLVRMVIPEPPQNLVGDYAYDSDKLDARLRRYGIELISPHRSNRKNRTQDLNVCESIGGIGRLKGCLLGYKTSGASLSATNDTRRTFSGCSTSAAA